jgi:hypothetical protein
MRPRFAPSSNAIPPQTMIAHTSATSTDGQFGQSRAAIRSSVAPTARPETIATAPMTPRSTRSGELRLISRNPQLARRRHRSAASGCAANLGQSLVNETFLIEHFAHMRVGIRVHEPQLLQASPKARCPRVERKEHSARGLAFCFQGKRGVRDGTRGYQHLDAAATYAEIAYASAKEVENDLIKSRDLQVCRAPSARIS